MSMTGCLVADSFAVGYHSKLNSGGQSVMQFCSPNGTSMTEPEK